MEALHALHTRSSSPRLSEPAPDAAALENIYRAAVRAADHGLLRPWRFLTIRGEGLTRLGRLFVKAAESEADSPSPAQIEKIRQKPLRAPMIVVTISSPNSHPKIPAFEQQLSAAAATQNMLVAAYAQGIGAMWRTGSMAYHAVVREGLGLNDHEKIIGFLYLGTPTEPGRDLPAPSPDDFVQEW